MYVERYVYTRTYTDLCVFACVYVYMCLHVFVYRYIYIYIYIHSTYIIILGSQGRFDRDLSVRQV